MKKYFKQFIALILGINHLSKPEVKELMDEQRKLYELQSQQILETEPQQPEQSFEPEDEHAVMAFMVNDKGQVNINMRWTSDKPHIAEALGRLMFHVHSGNFKNNCIQILQKMANDEPKHRDFIKKSINHWVDSTKESEPIMKPSEVFHTIHEAIGESE